jgi:hypothetical protein
MVVVNTALSIRPTDVYVVTHNIFTEVGVSAASCRQEVSFR